MPDRSWLVDELAERAHAVARAPLPAPVYAAARVHLADTVAALIAGHATLARGVADLLGGDGHVPANGRGTAAGRARAEADGEVREAYGGRDPVAAGNGRRPIPGGGLAGVDGRAADPAVRAAAVGGDLRGAARAARPAPAVPGAEPMPGAEPAAASGPADRGAFAPLHPDTARRTAFAAGAYVHCWEAAGIHRTAVLVPGCVVLPAVLAVLAARPELTWDELLRAYSAGYEVALAAGLAVGSDRLLARGWWPTALIGPLGGAAAASLLLGQPPRTTAFAIALAAQQAGGTVAGDSAGGDGRYLLAGFAGRRAVDAALAAGAGWRGPRGILDDARSPLRRREQPPPPDGFLLPETSIKPHTCAKHLQGAVDAVLELRRRSGDWRQGPPLAIDCELPAPLAPVVDRPPPFDSPLSALGSAQFVLALGALRGGPVPADFGPRDPAAHGGVGRYAPGDALDDPRLLGLAHRVTVRPADDLSAAFPAHWGARVEVTTAAGVHRAELRHSRGDPGAELTTPELIAKFTALAGPCLGPSTAHTLATALLTATPDAHPAPLTQYVLPLLGTHA